MEKLITNNKEKHHIFLNFDGDHWEAFYLWAEQQGSVVTLDNYKILFRKYIEEYSKTRKDEPFKTGDISDIVFNCFTQSSITPTNVFTFRGDKIHYKFENGVNVDYSKEVSVKCIHDIYSYPNFDPFKEAISILRENGINAWLGIRMNDNHFSTDKTSWIRDDFYYEAKQKGWFLNEVGCYDFSILEVRQKYLDYIDEQTTKYDVFGVEWDFQRNVHSIPTWRKDRPLEEYIDCMNDFIKRAYLIIKTKEKKWGHEIKINIRMHGYIEEAKLMGYDIKEWAKNDWMTSMTPAPFISMDTEIPVNEWIQLLHPYNIEVYAGIDPLFTPNITLEMYKGMSASFYNQGADAIYFHNLYRLDTIKELIGVVGGQNSNTEKRLIWHECSSADNAYKGKRDYVISGKEKPLYLSLYDINVTPAFPIEKDEYTYNFKTGYIINEYAYVYLSSNSFKDLYVDNIKIEYIGKLKESIVKDSNTFVYTLPINPKKNIYSISFGNCLLKDIRIKIFDKEQDFTSIILE